MGCYERMCYTAIGMPLQDGSSGRCHLMSCWRGVSPLRIVLRGTEIGDGAGSVADLTHAYRHLTMNCMISISSILSALALIGT